MTAPKNITRSVYRRSYVKEIVAIICIVAVSGFLCYSLFGPGGYRDLQDARLELHEQRMRVSLLESDVVRRTENTGAIDEAALKSGSPDALELLERRAREQGYARQGEYIQHIPDY